MLFRVGPDSRKTILFAIHPIKVFLPLSTSSTKFTSHQKVIVIGAGPAGCSCAVKLVKEGVKVVLIESSGSVGGLSRTIDLWGQKVDVGPHRFYSQEKLVNEFFHDVVQEEYTVIQRLTRIHFNGKFIQYPLKLTDALGKLGVGSILQVLWDYFLIRVFPLKDQNSFESWVTNRFGKKLFKLFFQSYSEKLWGIPCDKIDAEWASQRIQSLSLMSALKSAFSNNKNNKHKTLLDEFAYPKGGTGSIYQKCSELIKLNGGEILLNTTVNRVLLDKNNNISGVQLSNGSIMESSSVVSTMPLTALVKGFEQVPGKVMEACNSLRFRNTILVYLEIDSTSLFEDNWIYVHSEKVKHGRITNFRNWCPSLHQNKQSSILCMEFWTFENEPLWKLSDKELEELAVKELQLLKLVNEDHRVLNMHVLKVPKSYPVYKIGYKDHLKIIEDHLGQLGNLQVIGRYGAFKYNNQDHSILMGILAARNILSNDGIDLWSINTDTKYLEGGTTSELLQ